MMMVGTPTAREIIQSKFEEPLLTVENVVGCRKVAVLKTVVDVVLVEL